jgi:hypothetical protein
MAAIDVSGQVQELKTAITEFEAQYTKYTTENVNSAGSRARKALMLAKKQINDLRKTILGDQKASKAARKAAKAAAPAADAAPAAPKVGKKGKAEKAAVAE